MRNMLNRFCQDMLYSNVIDTHKMVLVGNLLSTSRRAR